MERGSERPLFLLRKMIMSKTVDERRKALNELSVCEKDFKDTLSIMNGYPVTIRLLDPRCTSLLPHDSEKLQALSKELGISMSILRRRVLAFMKITQCWATVVFVLVSAIQKLRKCR